MISAQIPQPQPSEAPSAPILQTVFDGLRREHGFEPLRVEGRLPVELAGTLYRNGPAVFDSGVDPHWFDGNGAVTAVRIAGGAAFGAVRQLHAPSAVHDRGRKRARYATFSQRMSLAQRVRAFFGAQALRNAANVNVLAWQGRTFAMYELTPPLEIDPRTLETIGETDLGGLVATWNGHPHRVASRATTYQFGMRVGPKIFLDVYALPDRGAASKLTTIRIPYVSEVHDFFATQSHLVFVITPLHTTAMRLLANGSFLDSMRWRPERGCEVIVVPIDRPSEQVRFQTDAFFWWHGINAFERDGGRTIVLDLVRYPEFFGHNRWIEETVRGGDGGEHTGRTYRGVLDLARRTARWEERYARPTEFPVVSPDVAGQAYRYGWMAGSDRRHDGRGWWDRIVRLDLESGASIEIDPGVRCSVGEPIVVPRSAREEDVWVLAHVRDLARGASFLGVWDGERPDDAPIARVWFDQLLPPGLHGTWVPSEVPAIGAAE